MKKYLKFVIIALMGLPQLSCAKKVVIKPDESKSDSIDVPKGWKYYDGDEFNGSAPSSAHWRMYGAPGVGKERYGQGNQQMIQTYRPSQIGMVILPGGEKVARITSVKDSNAPAPLGAVSDKTGWWSGALSSRDADKYYPLFSRIEIRAKAPNVYGVWHAFWLRYFNGSAIAELDLQEFFVKEMGRNILTQSSHLFNSSTGKTDVNVPNGKNRHFPIEDPQNTFHVYGVEIEPDPEHPDEAIITYLLNGAPTYSFSTHSIPGHNRFIKEAKASNLMKAWDFAITGQVGGNWVGYPEENLSSVVTEVDWVRCFIR